jgi:hypothetical protein
MDLTRPDAPGLRPRVADLWPASGCSVKNSGLPTPQMQAARGRDGCSVLCHHRVSGDEEAA